MATRDNLDKFESMDLEAGPYICMYCYRESDDFAIRKIVHTVTCPYMEVLDELTKFGKYHDSGHR